MVDNLDAALGGMTFANASATLDDKKQLTMTTWKNTSGATQVLNAANPNVPLMWIFNANTSAQTQLTGANTNADCFTKAALLIAAGLG